MKEENFKEGLSIAVKKSESIGDWFSEVITKSGFADYSPVKGCIYYLPPSIYAWNKIKEYTDQLFQEIGIEDVYLPLFIPEELFKKESEHIEGFQPEVAWVDTDSGRWAVRPTSEVLFSDLFAKKVRSYRDLPLKYNQWCSVVRMETKAVKPFLRGREFLWQETHAVYASEEEARKDVIFVLKNIYKKVVEELLLIPVFAYGRKTEKEKFAGAVDTYSIEGIMPDGRSLQLGTTHYLGDGFAKVFDISFLDENNSRKFVHQTSWGISTRLLGAALMLHSDDKGIVINPELVKHKIVFVPIIYTDNVEPVKVAKKLAEKLKRFNPIVDDRKYTPGWKFNEWELKGIPLRIEIGPKDLEKNQVVIVLRHSGEKIIIAMDALNEQRIESLFDKMKKEMFEKAKKMYKEFLGEVKTLEEFKVKKDNKILKVPFCNNPECETKVKEDFGVKSIVITSSHEKPVGNCIFCGKPAKHQTYFGKSY